MSKYSNNSDQELVALLNQGSEVAFNEIYNRYWSGVFLVAKNRLKNDMEAGEVVQDIFCNLWRKRIKFQLDKSLKVYFAVAVKYEIINRYAKRHRENILIEQLTYSIPQKDLSTQETISFNELERNLMDSIDLLPERSQLVFRLRFENGYSQKQIAEELNISEKTVEAHISKARKYIRTRLGPTLPFYILYMLSVIG